MTLVSYNVLDDKYQVEFNPVEVEKYSMFDDVFKNYEIKDFGYDSDYHDKEDFIEDIDKMF